MKECRNGSAFCIHEKEEFIMETISAMISGACIAAVVYYLFKEGWVSFLAGAIASVFSSIASKSNPEN